MWATSAWLVPEFQTPRKSGCSAQAIVFVQFMASEALSHGWKPSQIHIPRHHPRAHVVSRPKDSCASLQCWLLTTWACGVHPSEVQGLETVWVQGSHLKVALPQALPPDYSACMSLKEGPCPGHTCSQRHLLDSAEGPDPGGWGNKDGPPLCRGGECQMEVFLGNHRHEF